MKTCENCSSLNDGNYGSGRFCSSTCARGFSTKNKRTEINEKVSKTLTGSGHDKIIKTCIKCLSKFTVTYQRRNGKFCSSTCSANGMTEETRLKISKTVSFNRSIGNFSFNSIRCEFIFNDKQIRCDSKLEYRGLEKMCREFDVIKVERSTLIIPYIYEEKIRHFNPDFKITLADGTIIILECKSKISVNKTKKEIRPLYFLTVEQKMKALKDFCLIHKFKCWMFNGSKILEK